MPAARYFPPINTLEQKLQIQRRLGGVRSCKYFNLLSSFLSLKIAKTDFDRICIATIGRENITLHNHFLKSILKKASLPKTALPRQNSVQAPLNVKTPNGCNSLQPLCKNLPQSPRKCRTPNLRDRRFRGRPPLAPLRKNNNIGFENSTPKTQEPQIKSTPKIQEPQINSTPKIQELQSNSTPKIQEQPRVTDPQCAGNTLHASVECGKEVGRDSEMTIIKSPKIQERPRYTDPQCAGNTLHASVECGEVDRDSEMTIIESPKIQEQQRDTDPLSAGKRFPVSVEYGKEVDRDSERLAIIRSPIRAPLALPTYGNRAQRLAHNGLPSGIVTNTCESISYLPDTHSLMKRLEHNLETEGCNISADAANVLNKALDVYLKRLIKPCLDLAASKPVNKFSGHIQPGMNYLPQNRSVQQLIGSASASISDFRAAMELNPAILGEDWSLHFEKVCFRASEE
ncbi:putative transcriptional coactivator Hfi1/Transcriptional adapter 1 [Medicago truncatula]|uniref:Putative transcriptional coactivator Hfi1/Transcriptional adapter 1 n=1 Tax=Medicago truncatula TaxID=3880 RepID=G7JCU7_MEDTR|nr:uncharacterized protein LOC11407762 [Medicago truncatula]AES90672.2 transcriptional regulator of RNA polII, SAGA, subunit [Medicago truncatula]RHN63030.1 putative transcriptional coactivator Hfi1/Transcriptional adapter 1 [Medicago truncatula]